MFRMTTRRPTEPWQSLRLLSNALDEAFGTWQEDGRTVTASWYPACDVFEDKEAIKIVAEVPGVTPEDVKISLENNLLTIRGEKKQQAEERTERVHRYERELRRLRADASPCPPRPTPIEIQAELPEWDPDRERAQGRAGASPGDPGQRRLS